MTYRPRKPLNGNLICHTVLWTINGYGQVRHFDNRPEAEAFATAHHGHLLDITTDAPIAAPGVIAHDVDVEPDPNGMALIVVTDDLFMTRIGQVEHNVNTGVYSAYRTTTAGHLWSGPGLGDADTLADALKLIEDDAARDYAEKLCDDALNSFIRP